jgi:hypothetical protein
MLNIVPALILFCFNRTSNAGFVNAFLRRAR